MAQPYFRVYPKEILFDERFDELSAEQKGVWLLLLLWMWVRDIELKDNDERVSKMLGISEKRWKKQKEALMETGLIHEENGYLVNNELSNMYKETEDKCMKARKSAFIGWEKRKAKDSKAIAYDDEWPFGE